MPGMRSDGCVFEPAIASTMMCRQRLPQCLAGGCSGLGSEAGSSSLAADQQHSAAHMWAGGRDGCFARTPKACKSCKLPVPTHHGPGMKAAVRAHCISCPPLPATPPRCFGRFLLHPQSPSLPDPTRRLRCARGLGWGLCVQGEGGRDRPSRRRLRAPGTRSPCIPGAGCAQMRRSAGGAVQAARPPSVG